MLRPYKRRTTHTSCLTQLRETRRARGSTHALSEAGLLRPTAGWDTHNNEKSRVKPLGGAKPDSLRIRDGAEPGRMN